jgi:hypothetical protein
MTETLLINPRKRLNRELIIVAIGIVALGSTAIILGYQIHQRANAIANQRLTAAVKTAQLEILSKLTTQFAAAEPYLPKLQNILPRRDEMIGFDRNLIALAKERKVGFGFSFGGETPSSAGSAGWISFTITLQGSLDDITGYLDALNKLPYFIEFPGVDMGIRGGQYSTQLSGRVFTQ